MSTSIKRVSRKRNSQAYIFYVGNRERCDFQVNSVYGGYVYVEPYNKKFEPENFIKAIIGCFDKKSDFSEKLFKKLLLNPKERFYGFRITMDGVKCTITKENAVEVSKDVSKFYAENLQHLVRYLDMSTIFEFKNQQAEEKWNEMVMEARREAIEEKEWITLSIFSFARYWAKHMQYLREKTRRRLSTIAASTYGNDYQQDVTEPMKECAEDLLRQYWKYGAELDKWYERYQMN